MIRAALLSIVCLSVAAPLLADPRKPVHNGPQAVHKRTQARDLPIIRSSKVLRVLVNQSRNSSGDVKGQEVGIEYARLQAFEKFLNAQNGGKLTFKIIPKAKNQLVAALLRGEGDLIAPGELLYTSDKAVVASRPIVADVPLVVVGSRGQRSFRQLDQLSGRTLTLPTGSVADEALHRLNQGLAQRKLAPVHIEWVDPSLAVEDVLEMVEAGIYPMTLVEQPIAERWARVMPKLRVERNLKLHTEGNIGWFVRQDAPLLRESMDRFLASYRAPGNQDAVLAAAYKPLYRVNNPLARANLQRLKELRPLLQRHGEAQGIDWLDLAALAFKESKLDPSAKGSGGATGLLQITPSAARRVGVDNINSAEGNVQAAARYMALIQRKFFASPRINERERMAFVLAAYNLGPEQVQALRQEARRRGLNADQWFFQTERVAMEKKGTGVVTFVNSVNKYYLAFDRQRESLEQAPAGRKYVTRN
ncbi:transglycosylase SLT domain-containing protein [Pseudomonas sp. DTU_2021_1001937_2_SI_NGA_ILE_001]|uniref:transglycosylase SLT domain-containing protein n=1 Tax=Pseudomonas sp. DTU_2021_1001937_2_SI_NGA_ILE_001 TaxID=3077589 RepID=UPI0028FC0ED3|nr:transglycosylase SLT domain-containing protein [Pseudomonas sp. DTU_2021_1001937_2_SI_NGA_ILE_001]WNW10735.1 transglycosylase SLT domain-containing protein [Pseudomonas sp. DTU_2021_1001937_2_SI_NGA_ILE_001]